LVVSHPPKQSSPSERLSRTSSEIMEPDECCSVNADLILALTDSSG
jgi:hypothetical protein